MFPNPFPGVIGKEVQPDLFETANIKLECPFMLIRNYAKETEGLFVRIIGKISAFTILQYINKINNNPIGRVKYALN